MGPRGAKKKNRKIINIDPDALNELKSAFKDPKVLRAYLELSRVWEKLHDMRIVANRSGERFAQKVVDRLNELIEENFEDDFFISQFEKIHLTKVDYIDHRNGEIEPQIRDSSREKNVYLFGLWRSGGKDFAYDFMELQVLGDAIHRDDAAKIIAVFPEYPFERQDKKVRPRTPISAKMVADIFQAIGCENFMAMDLHSESIEGYVKKSLTKLYAFDLFTSYIRENFDLENCVLASPDLGANRMLRRYAAELNLELITEDKIRDLDNKPSVGGVHGRCDILEGKTVLCIDDIIDSGGTVYGAYDWLKPYKFKDFYAFCTQALLNDPAPKEFKKRGIKVYGTDTVPKTDKFLKENAEWYTELSVAEYFAEAIFRKQIAESVSDSKYLYPAGLKKL